MIEAPLQLRRTVSDRAVDGRVIDADAAFSHHFLLIAEAQTSGRVPANTKQDHGLVEFAVLEPERSSGATPHTNDTVAASEKNPKPIPK